MSGSLSLQQVYMILAHLFLTFASATALEPVVDTSLTATDAHYADAMHVDDTCAAADGEGNPSCSLSALQVRARAVSPDCTGPWCDDVLKFDALFDSNNPAKMQEAMDTYTVWPSSSSGIKIAVTKDHYYEMYHGNVKAKIAQYVPQGLFDWKFSPQVVPFDKTTDTFAMLVRDGTMTMNLGRWRRGLFWNGAVQALPAGMNFPFDHEDNFDDCINCPAKMILKVNKTGSQWKITDIVIVKEKKE